jgi:hypothetical protein
MKHAARLLRRYAAAAGGSRLVLAAAAAATVLVFGGCNPERKVECERLMEAMKPVSDTVPTADGVDSVKASVAAIKFEDQTLGVYAKNYSQTLTVLSSTLRLKSSPDAPDGTEDVIKRNLQEARTDAQDTARYCAQ